MLQRKGLLLRILRVQDGVERADAAEDGAQSFARGVGACLGCLIRARQLVYAVDALILGTERYR